MIKLDMHNNIEDYTLILSKRNHDHLGQLSNVSDVTINLNMNAADELSFVVYRYRDTDEQEDLWNDITDFKYVYVKELNEYFEIAVELNEEESIYKSITGTSACEAELSQSYVYGLEINTEEDIARADYVNPTKFYDELHPECSLLNRILYKLPHYSIKHVDTSLLSIQRTFSADGDDVYSLLTNTVAEEVSCIFIFDSADRSISAYDLKTSCVDCGHRGDFTDVCPECGSTDLIYYGEDTTIYIDRENLAENITFATDTESVKNCFKLEAGDENMTAAVINSNPNGSSYIYYFSEDQKKDMSPELVAKLDDYDALNDSYKAEYKEVMDTMYDSIDKVVYYTSEMMPERKDEKTDAKKEAAKLTMDNLSPMGMPEVHSSTSTSTVNTALKNYAKVYVKSGYFKIEINEGEFSYEGIDIYEHHYGFWYGNFKITNYSDEEDVAVSTKIKIRVDDDYKTFLEQKIEKKIANNKDEDGNIFDVLSIKELVPFKDALTYYCLNRLISFNDAIQGVIDIMIEEDQANENSDLYEELYLPYYNKLLACQEEMDKRAKTIKGWEDKLDVSEVRQKEIHKLLNFEAFLGDELYKEFLCFKREDKYSNDNYISDGFENNEIFQKARDFLEVAKEELIKSGEHQHSITANVFNLLAMKEFKPLRDKFALGNFIRVGVDNKVYRLRLISCQISFQSLENIDVEFSDVTKIKNGTSDMESVLSQASSVASTYDATIQQVKNSKEQTDMMKNFVRNGLDATLMKIVNNADNQSITIDENGLLARRKDEFLETWEGFALKLINNGLYFTDNNWRTVKAAFGKYYYTDPETGKREVKYGMMGSTIIGQLLIGEQLKLYSNDASAEMSFDGFGLRLNTKKNANGQYKRIFDIQKDGNSIFYVDNQGNLVFAEDQFIDMIEKLDRVNVKYLDAENLYAKTGTILKFASEYAKIEELMTPVGTITALTSETIEAVTGHFTGDVKIDTKILAAAGQIDALKSTTGDIGELTSFKATLENLNSKLGDITNLTSDYIKVNKLEATDIKFDELEAVKATITNLIADLATVTTLNATVANIPTLNVSDKATIEYVVANTAEIKKLICDLAEIKNLKADIANLKEAIIPTLTSTTATIDNLTSKLATITTLNSTTITADKIVAKSADIEELNAVLGDFDEIKAQIANIQSIMAGNIGTGLLQTIHLTAKNFVADDAIIASAMIKDLDVSKLNAGTISTDKIKIASDDGGINIEKSTMQFKDKNNVARIQIGKDAQDDFSFSIFDETGTGVLIDENGIHEGAIPDQIIKDSMVSDDANISGSKLERESLIDKINEDGSKTISSSKIWVDEEGQSLGVSFKQITDKVDETIKSTTPYFAKSTSNTTAPTTGWQTTLPTRSANEYIWRKDLITKTDGSTIYNTPYVITGDKGNDGINAITYYTWMKYADTPTTGMSDDPAGKSYMGLAYNKTSKTESTKYADYTWSLIKGSDGISGEDGKTYYTWIKYADTPTTGISDSPDNKKYVGLAYNKTTSTPSVIYSDYKWSLIKGEDGIDGKTSYFFVRYSANSNGNPMVSVPDSNTKYMGTATSFVNSAPTTYTSYTWSLIKGKDGTNGSAGEKGENGQTSYLHVKYSNDGKVFTSNNGEDIGSWIGTYVDFIEADSSVFSDYSWKKFVGDKGEDGIDVTKVELYYYISDSNTTQTGGSWSTTAPTWTDGKYIWSKQKTTLSNGKTSETAPVCITGGKGQTGSAGIGITKTVIEYQNATSGTTVPTGTWSTTIPTVSPNQYLWTRTTITYSNSTTSVSYSIGKNGASGTDGKGIKSTTITYQASASGTTTPTGTWSTTIPSVPANQYLWTRTVITYTDSTTSTSYSISKIGANGANGATGTGIESITAEYYLSTSKTTQTGGSWVTTPPVWITGKYMWTRSKIVYKNPTSTAYTTPICDTSWEVADAVDKKLTTLQTDFKVEQGKITELIKETTIDNGDGTTSKLKDKYLDTVKTVDGINTTIADVKTDVGEMDSRITEIKATADGVSSTVSASKGKWDQASTDAKGAQTTANQTAEKFSWIVKSGTNGTNFELTDRTASLVANNINLKGLVSFSGLNSEVKDKINSAGSDIEIGGRNLLEKTNQGNTNWKWALETGKYTTESVVGDNINCVKFIRDDTESTGYSAILFDQEDLKTKMRPNTDYTLSFEIKPTASGIFRAKICCSNGTNCLTNTNSCSDFIANVWNKISIQLRSVGTFPAGKEQQIYLYNMKSSINISYMFRNMKLERGNKATDWTPAPEDKVDKSLIDTWTSDAITGGITTINGGYVKTQTISTNQLNVTEILAENGTFLGIINAQNINADRIVAGTIGADRLNLHNLSIRQSNTDIETLFISNSGDITMRGNIESYDYTQGKVGWSMRSNGDIEINDLNARGSIVTNDGGIASSGGSGRNLLMDSGTKVTTTNYLIKIYKFGDLKPVVGKTYTITLKGSLGAGKLYFGLYNSGDSVLIGYMKSKGNGIFQLTAKWVVTNKEGTSTANNTQLNVYAINNMDPNPESTIEWIKMEEGEIATPWSLAPEDKIKQVRFWAGASYEDRDYAPWIVYNDGSMVAQDGTFSGVFTGQVRIGNISIIDPSSIAGGDAILTIQNGNTGVKTVQLGDTVASTFAQNLNITDNAYTTNISLHQDGTGVFKSAVSVGSKTSLTGTSLTLNGFNLTTGGTGYIFACPQVNVGSASNDSLFKVYGNTFLNGQVTVESTLNFGDIVKCTNSDKGIDFNFIK